MPELLSLLVVSVSVGLSNFAGAIGIGLSGIDNRTRLRVGVAFGLFEALMPLIGLALGQAASGFFGHSARYVGGGLLIFTGAYTIVQGIREEAEQKRAEQRNATREEPEHPQSTRHLLITALALSIDNLAVGFAIAVYHVNIVAAALTIGLVSVAMSLVGLELGHRLGAYVEAWSEELSGGVLIAVGIAIAAGLFH